MNKFLLLGILIPFTLIAQQKEGIKFSQETSWDLVVNKARKENKYIFVDLFATWCGPCKWMDKEVFSKENVGNLINTNFVSIKLQCDTTKNDNDFIKNWHNDVKSICLKYNINTFPTYLFFSPNGEPVHRQNGAMTDSLFIEVVNSALNPQTQYYTLLNKYKKGDHTKKTIMHLARNARLLGDILLANSISRKFIQIMDSCNNKILLKKDNLQFLYEFSGQLNSKDNYFKLCYNESKIIDSILGRREISISILDNVITKEEISKYLAKENRSSEPDWNKIKMNISKKYNDKFAERNVLNAQLKWYTDNQMWEKVIKYYIIKAERYGLDTAGLGKTFLNNFVFEIIFMHSNDTYQINKGIQWMEMLLKEQPNDPAGLDTYANLLYKTGRVTAAIALEEKAEKIEIESAKTQRRDPDPIYSETISKMKKGEPTWAKNND